MLLKKIGIFLLVWATSNVALGFDLKKDIIYGVQFGFGGSGLDKQVDVQESVVDVSRSESPGMLGVSAEFLLSDKWTVALGHRRGFRLGPFSAGVSFTGFTWRRYFMRPMPFLPSKRVTNTVTTMNWAPYIGLGTGIAYGQTSREGDLVDEVSSSGVYMGIHIGVDYHLYPNMILRPEFFTSGTFMNTSNRTSTLSEYGLIVGLQFRI